MHPIVFLPVFITILIVLSGCSANNGRIVILENPNGTGFTMDFKDWSSSNKCELSLGKDDVLQIEVVKDGGEVGLVIRGQNGTEPYTGNNLQSMRFTVRVSETDRYVFHIAGKNASGKITVKKLR